MQAKLQNCKKQNMLFHVEYQNSEYLILFFSRTTSQPAGACQWRRRNAENIPSRDHAGGIIFSHVGVDAAVAAGKKEKEKKRRKRRRCGGDVSEVFPPVISGLPPLRFPRVNPVISATQARRAAGRGAGGLGALHE